MSKNRFVVAVASLLLSAGFARAQGTTATPSPDLRQLAEDGFIYGLPIVMNYGVMYDYVIDKGSGQWKAPFNQLSNEARVFTYKDTTVITPNSDTPYSMGWLDLGAEPVVVSVPAVEKRRYYSVMLCDGNTFNFGYIGSRATGNDAGDYLVAGPEWKGEAPAGIRKTFHSSTRFALAIFRTQLFDASDMPNVVKVQSGYKTRPLSAYLKRPAPAALPPVSFPKIDKELAKTNFFEYVAFALQFAPAGPEEKEIRAKLAQLRSKVATLTPAEKAELAEGMKSGEAKVGKYLAAGMKDINGWSVGAAFGDRAFYNGNWLLRAAAAQGGIYGNDAAEAMYPMTKTLADGTALDGSAHKYTLTFAKDQLPPVNAFWSVTMYDGKTQLLIQNPIDRYLINSPMLTGLKKNADGSLTIYIQKDSPGKDKESNWLPAPNGPIYLVMRLYWPRETPPSILPPGEGTWKPPALAVAD